MEKYVFVARSHKYPDVFVKVIDADNDIKAMECGKDWMRDDIGFMYYLTVAKVIYNNFSGK